MCLSVPARVINIFADESKAEVDYFGSRKLISIALLDDVEIGQYVLVHAGEAIQVIDEENAKASLAVWKEVLDL
jgi:hydrogenase expression/formation protein HypC